jgi:hypothetical protein
MRAIRVAPSRAALLSPRAKQVMREVVDAKWLSRKNIHENVVGDFTSSLGVCRLRNVGRSIPRLRSQWCLGHGRIVMKQSIS